MAPRPFAAPCSEQSVTDSEGAVIPAAAVVVKNMDTGIERAIESHDQGNFTATELPIGRYSVNVTKQGFNVFRAEGIEITVSGQVTISVSLKAGDLNQSVVVTANPL